MRFPITISRIMDMMKKNASDKDVVCRLSVDGSLCSTISGIEVHGPCTPTGVAAGRPLQHRCGNRACRFFYCMTGDSAALPEERANGNPCCRQSLAAPGFCHLFYGYPCQSPNLARGTGIRWMEIRLDRRHLLRLLGRHRLARVLWHAEREGRPFTVSTKITPAMNQILRMMAGQTSGRDTPLMFTAAKALELMWLFVDAVDETQDNRVNPRDRNAVRSAQTILENRLTDPPPLTDLAASVGMSLSKFKSLFPRVCGHPPYAYLRRARMDRAFHLLNHTDMNVTEVALEVGYACPSRFSKAFAGQFGFSPSTVRRSHATP